MTTPKKNNFRLGGYAFLRDSTGEGNANRNFADAGGTAPEGAIDFFLGPPLGEVWFASRLVIKVQDTGSMDSGGYGNGSALINGIKIRVVEDVGAGDVEVQDLLDTETIKTNAGWGVVCFDVGHHNFGQGDEFILIRWTFVKGGRAIRLDGDRKQRIVATFNDDLSGLNFHTFFVHGWNDYLNSDNEPIPYANRSGRNLG